MAGGFRPAQTTPAVPRSAAFLGLAAGTAARQYRLAFGDQVDIPGVEIDPDILAVGHRYFHLDEARAHEVVADARYWLDTQAGHYDVVVLDAYRQPYIPFHLTTEEFFQQVRTHLNPGGVVAVNVGRTATDYRLVDALASTMAAVFPSGLLVDDPNYTNTVVYASMSPVTVDDVTHNLKLVSAPLAIDASQSALQEGKLGMPPYRGQVYTYNLPPTPHLVNPIILTHPTPARKPP